MQNNHLVNQYALPRGLNACQKIPVQSESERFFDNRYSKQAIGEMKIKDCFTILGRTTQIDGFKGHKHWKTAQGPRRNQYSWSNKPQSWRNLRPNTTQQWRFRKKKNLYLENFTTEKQNSPKQGCFPPNFSITPMESTGSTSNFKIKTHLISPINYSDPQNKDIQEVKNLMKKYSNNKIRTHQYVEVNFALLIKKKLG